MKRKTTLKVSGARRERAGRWADRGRTAAAVASAIECITTVPGEGIVVTVDRGWVRLEGKVPEWHQRDTIENLVRHLDGVKGVLNLIIAEPSARPRAGLTTPPLPFREPGQGI